LPHEGLIGYFVPAGPTESLGRIIVTPVAAFERPLTLSRASSLGTAATLTLTPADQVQSVTGATGTPLSPSGTSPQLMIDPIVSASDTTVGGGSGIADLRLAAGRGAVTLDAGHRPVQVLWQSADTDASLTSSPGHVVTGFDARTGALTLSPKRGTSAPRTATVQLTDKLDGDRSERILTVTGPPDVSAVLTGAHAVLTSARSGRFTISLSSLGAGQMAQSAGLGTILLAAGQKLTVTPGRWSALAGATVNARVVGGRRATRRLRLRDRLRIPTAHVIDAAAHGSSVRVTVRIPALPIGAASVSISIRATRHGRLLGKGIASLPAGGRARTDRTTITLRHPIQTGARLAIIVQTVAGGATPTEATSTHVSRSD
jgi:hypothetical protein